MQDEDYSELETTADEFDAMWEEAEPVETQTLTPFVSPAATSAAAYQVKIELDVSWGADTRRPT